MQNCIMTHSESTLYFFSRLPSVILKNLYSHSSASIFVRRIYLHPCPPPIFIYFYSLHYSSFYCAADRSRGCSIIHTFIFIPTPEWLALEAAAASQYTTCSFHVIFNERIWYPHSLAIMQNNQYRGPSHGCVPTFRWIGY